MPTNATKYLFCCVRYWDIQKAPVFCPHGVDSPEWPGTSAPWPHRPAHRLGRRLAVVSPLSSPPFLIAGGGGNAEPAARAG